MRSKKKNDGHNSFFRKLIRKDNQTMKEFTFELQTVYETLKKQATYQRQRPIGVGADIQFDDLAQQSTKGRHGPSRPQREDSSDRYAQASKQQGQNRHGPHPTQPEYRHAMRRNDLGEREESYTPGFSRTEADRAEFKMTGTQQREVAPRQFSENQSRHRDRPTKSLEAIPQRRIVSLIPNVRGVDPIKARAEHQMSKAGSSSKSYLGNTIHVPSPSFVDEHRSATLGGQILVKDQLWDLTIGHVFLRDDFSMRGSLTQHPSRSASSISDIFSLDSDSDEDDGKAPVVPKWREEAGVFSQLTKDDFAAMFENVPVESFHGSLDLADQLRVIPSMSMEGDWAILYSRQSPRRQDGNWIDSDPVRRFDSLRVSKANRLEQTQPVDVLRRRLEGLEPWKCNASASLSLICLPGTEMLQKAHSLNTLCSKSFIHPELICPSNMIPRSWQQRCLGC